MELGGTVSDNTDHIIEKMDMHTGYYNPYDRNFTSSFSSNFNDGAGSSQNSHPYNPYRSGRNAHKTYNPFINMAPSPGPNMDLKIIPEPNKAVLKSECIPSCESACITWFDLKRRFSIKAYELRNSIISFEDNARTLPTSSIAITICRSLQNHVLPQLLLINKIVLCELRHAQSVGGVLDLSQTDYPAEDLTWHYRKFHRALDRLRMSLEDMSMDNSSEPARNSPKCDPRQSRQSEGRMFETFSQFRNKVLQDSLIRMDGVTAILQSARLRTGLEKVRYNQEYSRTTFMNMATIATFLSSVTATTLQYSYSQTSASEELWAYVNGVWFSSLVFSVASAANSFLGVVLYQRPEYFGHSSLSEYRCIRFWFDKCPIFFLIISGSLFGIGLCLFAVSSNQAYCTQVITIALTAIHAIFIVAIFSMASVRLVRLLVPKTFRFFCPSWSEDV